MNVYFLESQEGPFEKVTVAVNEAEEFNLLQKFIDDETFSVHTGDYYIQDSGGRGGRFAEMGRYDGQQSFFDILSKLNQRVAFFGSEAFLGVGVDHEHNISQLSFEERIARIDQYALEHPGQPVSPLLLQLFPGIEHIASPQIAMPNKAPRLWRGSKEEALTPPEFIREVYGPWIGRGLTRNHLRRLDKKLYGAVGSWMHVGAPWPEDLPLPTLKEANDEWVHRVGQAMGADQLGEIPTSATAMRRFLSASSRRARE